MRIERLEKFLNFFGVEFDDDNVYCNTGDLSIICNPETEWTDFLGRSIYSVAGQFANMTGRLLVYENDPWDWIDRQTD